MDGQWEEVDEFIVKNQLGRDADLEAALASRPDLQAKLETALRKNSPDDNPGISEDSGIV